MTDWAERNMQVVIAKRQKFADTRRVKATSVSKIKFRRESRYDCRECGDSGFVTIYTPEGVRILKKDPEATYVPTCAAQCGACSKLRNADHVGKVGKRNIPVFGEEDWHVNVRDPRARLDAAAYVHRPAGFNEEFAEFSK